MASIANGVLAKINGYYDTITHWSIAINAFQWLASFHVGYGGMFYEVLQVPILIEVIKWNIMGC